MLRLSSNKMHNYCVVIVTLCIYTSAVKLCQIILEKLEKGQVLPNINKGGGAVVEPQSLRNSFNCTADTRVPWNLVGKH